MRRFLLGLALTAAVAMPFGSTPVSAQILYPGYCNEDAGYQGPIPIAGLQEYGIPRGLARQASAQDVNHNGFVCYKLRGSDSQRSERSVTFADDFIPCVCQPTGSEVESSIPPEALI
jgi:hypothetical protein